MTTTWPCPHCGEPQRHEGYGEESEYRATHGPGMCVEDSAMDGQQFLAKLFEFELCAECGRDSDQHTATLDMFDNWHAWCRPCSLCAETGRFEDEVSDTLFCEQHAGALAWSDCKVNAYTIAVRVAGHLDVPVTGAWTVAA